MDTVTVVLTNARDLIKMDDFGFADPFCVVRMQTIHGTVVENSLFNNFLSNNIIF